MLGNRSVPSKGEKIAVGGPGAGEKGNKGKGGGLKGPQVQPKQSGCC